MSALALARLGLARELRGDGLLPLLAALALGVAAMGAVRLFAQRLDAAFVADGAAWLGGDLGVAGRTPVAPAWLEEARRRGLAATRIVQFPSVLFHGERSVLAEVKAVDESYPLRGSLNLAAPETAAPARAPPPGAAYAEARLLEALGLAPGDRIELGGRALAIAGVLIAEPDLGGELFQLAPRLLVRLEDLDGSGLLGPGSRAAWRLMVAGSEPAVRGFREWLEPRLEAHRLLGPGDVQRLAREAIDRARRFLGLAALLTVLIAGTAIAFAAARFAAGRLDEVALLRCLGATPRRLLAALGLRLLLAALPAIVVGLLLAIGIERLLAAALGALLPATASPLPDAASLLVAVATALLLLLGFAGPPLARLGRVPPARILKRELGGLPRAPLLLAAAGGSVALLLLLLAAGWESPRLLLLAGAGLAGLAASAAAAGWLALRLARRAAHGLRGGLALGLRAVTRQPTLAVAQVAALALALFGLLLLTAIGPALLRQWRTALPPDTPNWFLLNIQDEQAAAVRAALAEAGATALSLEPFATGRLLAINGRPPRAEDFPDPRAAAWIHGPLNLSWREGFPPANRLLAGRFWRSGSGAGEASVERSWAEIFGTRLGDRYRVAIADREYEFTVTSLREAEWSSFRVNFFILLHPATVAEAPHQWVASFHLPADRRAALRALIERFPNLSLIEVGPLLERLRATLTQVMRAVELLLASSLGAGLALMLAALAASGAERRREAALMRTLGASRRQLALAALAEFGLLGLLAALIAAGGALLAGALLARHAFALRDFAPPWDALAGVLALGLTLGLAAGWLARRQLLGAPPLPLLRRAE